LSILIQRWRDILINFIVDLLSSNGFTNIMVVVDCFMKMRYMVPIDSINAVLVAEYFVRYVFKLHRLPNSIVSDYGSQFVLDF
jgi:phage gp36-like protein